LGLRLPELQLTPDAGGGGAGVGVEPAVAAGDAEDSADSLAEGLTLVSAEADDAAEAELVADGAAEDDGWHAARASSRAARPYRNLTVQR
jgi:hypothetical protein